MMKQLPSFADAQRAIREGKDPMAFFHLGILYAQGNGTTQDEILAHYFLQKAYRTYSHERHRQKYIQI